jgi:hypothetical protein
MPIQNGNEEGVLIPTNGATPVTMRSKVVDVFI